MGICIWEAVLDTLVFFLSKSCIASEGGSLPAMGTTKKTLHVSASRHSGLICPLLLLVTIFDS